MNSSIDYNVYKGVQRPIEFKGLKGKFIYIAAGVFFGGLLLGIAMFAMEQVMLGLICMFAGVVGVFVTFLRQKKGLHKKNNVKGLFIVKTLFNNN